jgi:hypothetical protein
MFLAVRSMDGSVSDVGGVRQLELEGKVTTPVLQQLNERRSDYREP